MQQKEGKITNVEDGTKEPVSQPEPRHAWTLPPGRKPRILVDFWRRD
jgi:hypothetical protein